MFSGYIKLLYESATTITLFKRCRVPLKLREIAEACLPSRVD